MIIDPNPPPSPRKQGVVCLRHAYGIFKCQTTWENVAAATATATAAAALMVSRGRRNVRLRNVRLQLDQDTPIDDIGVRRFDNGCGRITWHRFTDSAAGTIRPGSFCWHHNLERKRVATQ